MAIKIASIGLDTGARLRRREEGWFLGSIGKCYPAANFSFKLLSITNRGGNGDETLCAHRPVENGRDRNDRAAPLAQSSATKPSFEVASVKPSAQAGNFGGIRRTPGDRFTANNVGLRFLIQYAYRVRDFQIIGGPSWMATDRWDVEAKAEEGSVAPPAGPLDPNVIDGINLRLQSLLEDRFQLKLHHETRELSGWIHD